ncbi:methyl-accepting chemotaxis protein [Desulfofundulus sp.]|uniref:methyl-accepting chemotaxis protein n=1 Tax=Desulfofundulus sp. TaxID=2282750 RepID=UPI003C75DBC4
MKFSVGARIGGGFVILLLFLAFIAGEGVNVVNKTNKNLDDIEVRFQRISLDYRIQIAYTNAMYAMRGFMVYGSDRYLDEYRQQMDLTRKLLEERLRNVSAQNKENFERVLEKLNYYDQKASQSIVPLIKEGKTQEAIAEGKTIAPINAEISSLLNRLIIENEGKSKSLIERAVGEGRSGRQTVLILSSIALLLSICLAFFITRSITGPVKTIMQAVQRIAGGDFTQPVCVKVQDELGNLAVAVERTREQLKELVGEIASAAETLTSRSEEVASSSEEISATVEEVASATGEVAATAEKGLDNASLAAAESKRVAEVAQTGGQTIKQTVDKINAIAVTAGRVNQAIQQLGDLSARIENITNTITGIADQTNLLALNAAIEAARAGEQGRGFAVVAEEVRKLAEQSASAAREIGQLIAQVQSGVGEAIRAMEEGAREVQEGVAIASGAGEALKNIEEAIGKSVALVEEITEGAKQTSDGTQQLAASAEQISATIQQITSSTQELAALAHKLQLLVGKFKI